MGIPVRSAILHKDLSTAKKNSVYTKLENMATTNIHIKILFVTVSTLLSRIEQAHTSYCRQRGWWRLEAPSLAS
jgi:hypothetical protein